CGRPGRPAYVDLHDNIPMKVPEISRRDWLLDVGAGFGSLALAQLLARDGALADSPRPDLNGGLHHRARVRRVVQLFMNGGMSQCDTFDHKPELEKRHGKKFDPGGGARVEAGTSTPGTGLKGPVAFQRSGGCGRVGSGGCP